MLNRFEFYINRNYVCVVMKLLAEVTRGATYKKVFVDDHVSVKTEKRVLMYRLLSLLSVKLFAVLFR